MWNKKLIKMLEKTGFSVVFSKAYPLGRIYLNHELIMCVSKITRDFKTGVYYFYGFDNRKRAVAMILKTHKGAVVIEHKAPSHNAVNMEPVYSEMLAKLLDVGGTISFERVGEGYVGTWQLDDKTVFTTPPQPTVGAVLWRLEEELEKRQLSLWEDWEVMV